jgi:DNA-binding NarL/FixJ family response regulator
VTRVLIVDDQALVRAGFEALVESADDLEVVGTAANGREAVELARRESPDVVLMDVRMPVMDGLEATRILLSDPATASTRVLVFPPRSPASLYDAYMLMRGVRDARVDAYMREYQRSHVMMHR